MRTRAALGLGLAAFLFFGCGGGDTPTPPDSPRGSTLDPGDYIPEAPLTWADIQEDGDRYLRILAAEDRRAREPADLDSLRAALEAPQGGIRRAAVRALGRLERPELAREMVGLLGDDDPRVRGEAANAMAQSVRQGSDADRRFARNALLTRLQGEGDRETAVAVARSVGRIPVTDAGELGRVERALEGAPDPAAARGAFFLYRSMGSGLEAGPGFLRRLERIARGEVNEEGEAPAPQVRRNALAARLQGHTPPDPSFLLEFMGDRDPEVRRLAAGHVGRLFPPGDWIALADRALSDPVDRVRIEGARGALWRVWADEEDRDDACTLLVEALDDPSDHVALLAMDGLANGCHDDGTREQLEALADRLDGAGAPGSTGGSWHRPMRAALTLARLHPERAVPHLRVAVAHRDPFVRAHAARMAVVLEDRDALRALADDPFPNVRHAGIPGVVELLGATPPREEGSPLVSEAQERLVDHLFHDDPQLLRYTANAMEGWVDELPRGSAGAGRVVDALYGALERQTAFHFATSRDARLPLIVRIGELGTAAERVGLERWLQDRDPRVRDAAATILGRSVPEAPGFEELPLPTLDELREMEGARVVLTFEGVGEITVGLFPFEAPTNAARFYRMAQGGEFDGLTLHRVVPNFVLQGGSPGANEYVGHGAYTRDERGLPGHWRGTLGISTRGRDTGDGQIFLNLVDNLRLDHDYTVFAVVMDGWEVMDAIQEGARMTRVRVEGR